MFSRPYIIAVLRRPTRTLTRASIRDCYARSTTKSDIETDNLQWRNPAIADLPCSLSRTCPMRSVSHFTIRTWIYAHVPECCTPSKINSCISSNCLQRTNQAIGGLSSCFYPPRNIGPVLQLPICTWLCAHVRDCCIRSKIDFGNSSNCLEETIQVMGGLSSCFSSLHHRGAVVALSVRTWMFPSVLQCRTRSRIDFSISSAYLEGKIQAMVAVSSSFSSPRHIGPLLVLLIRTWRSHRVPECGIQSRINFRVSSYCLKQTNHAIGEPSSCFSPPRHIGPVLALPIRTRVCASIRKFCIRSKGNFDISSNCFQWTNQAIDRLSSCFSPPSHSGAVLALLLGTWTCGSARQCCTRSRIDSGILLNCPRRTNYGRWRTLWNHFGRNQLGGKNRIFIYEKRKVILF